MMNIYDDLPWEITINGQTFDVDMSFDNIIRTEAIRKDTLFFEFDRVNALFKALFDLEPLDDYDLMAFMVEEVSERLIAGNVEEEAIYDIAGNKLEIPEEEVQKTFDLFEDMEYIYSSFMLDYKIDLYKEKGKMHWWQFRALLNGLSEEAMLTKVIKIRTMEVPTGKGTEKEAKKIRELKNKFRLKGVEVDGEERWENYD